MTSRQAGWLFFSLGAALVLACSGAVIAQTPPTELDVLLNIRTQLQDVVVLNWAQLATQLVMVGLLAAVLGGQR